MPRSSHIVIHRVNTYNTLRVRLSSQGVKNDGMSFHKNLKRLRIRAGLSQEQLAHAIGRAGQSVIGNYEAGKREPKASEIPALAKAVNAEIQELFGMEPAQQSQVARPDPQILTITEQTLDEFYKLVLGHVPVRHDPEEIAALYPLIVAGPEEEGSRGALIEFSEWWRRKKKDELVKESGEGAGDTAGIPSERKIKAAGGRGR